MSQRIHAQTSNSPLSVNELGETLQKMADAFLGTGNTPNRSSFEKWKKRYQNQGVEALSDVPPRLYTHPASTLPATLKRVIDLSMTHPSWGCVRIAKYCKEVDGISISSPTVQNILLKEGLGSRYARLLHLQGLYLQGKVDLSEEQIKLIEWENPSFCERDLKTASAGKQLIQDTFYIGNLPNIGKCYLNTVLDAHSLYAFGFLHSRKQPESAVAVLHNEVLPFYAQHGIEIQTMLSDSDKEFAGKTTHPYQVYLMFNDIKHRQLPSKKLANGHMERFKNTLNNEFKAKSMGCDSFDSLQKHMANWFSFYNNERTHDGYPNMGKPPAEVLLNAVRSVAA